MALKDASGDHNIASLGRRDMRRVQPELHHLVAVHARLVSRLPPVSLPCGVPPASTSDAQRSRSYCGEPLALGTVCIFLVDKAPG